MGLLRSEPMQHGTIILPVEQAREYVDLLGLRANIQLEDMNETVYLRPYRTYIQRIVAMERSLRFIRDEIRSMPGWEDEIQGGDVDGFLSHEKEYNLNSIEAELKRLEDEFTTIKENLRGLLAQRNNTTEALYVARLASAFHTPQPQQAESSTPSSGSGLLRRLSAGRLSNASQQGSGSRGSIGSNPGGFLRRLSKELTASAPETGDQFEVQALKRPPDFHEYGIAVGPAEAGRPLGGGVDALAGAVARDAQARFARALFRATRGNVFTHFVEIHEPLIEPKTNKETYKSVFVIYFQSQIVLPKAQSFMREKITRVCNAFDAAVYTWYTDHQSAEAAKEGLQKQIAEQAVLVNQVRKYMRQEAQRLVKRVAYPDGNSVIEEWRLFCAKEKSIYATLNYFEGNTSLRASCWYPASEADSIRTVLTNLSDAKREVASARAMLVADKNPPRHQPPTYIRRNELTDVIQDLVDTYGLPRYQEANPALFSVVTFPFLFGIMYGDVGHGLMLFLVGLTMCVHAERLRKLSPQIYAARYLVAMMGFFATYAGLLYNDFFSVGLELFESRWQRVQNDDGTFVSTPKYDTKNDGGIGPYPFGLDPGWHGATNELMFVNSLKMKLSVIVGVVHMAVGILLRWANAFHAMSVLDFVFECIPMMVFLVCFFGFMDAMIIYKWVTPIDDAPSIINSMICMALPMNKDKAPMFGEDMPKYLMLATAGSVLLMLLPKPFILLALHGDNKKNRKPEVTPRTFEDVGGTSVGLLQAQAASVESGRASASAALLAHGDQEEEEEEEFEFSEVLMHQIIETIEYTLGTVSHTASYLRLWALSLAHAQLSAVFFEKTIGMALDMSFPVNGFALYIAFAVWLSITLAILLGMDVMECTLHTLRLHWVEFQSKFYKADGYGFHPYNHKAILQESVVT